MEFKVHWWLKFIALTILLPALWMMYYLWQSYSGLIVIIPSIIIVGAIVVTLLPWVSSASIKGHKLRYGMFIKRTINLANVKSVEEHKIVRYNPQHGQYASIGLLFHMNNGKGKFMNISSAFGPRLYDEIERVTKMRIKRLNDKKLSRNEVVKKVKEFIEE
jgi:hypothetical protein